MPWEQELPPEKRCYDVRYILGGPGKIGMGIVYLAYDRKVDAPYAIKTFQDRFLGNIQSGNHVIDQVQNS